LIICGDTLTELRKLPEESVDAVITDPPYSSGTRKEGAKGLRKSMKRGTDDGVWFSSDSMTVLGFSWLMRESAIEWKRLLKPGGHVLCFIDWRMYPHLAGAIESSDLRHVGVLVWDKTYFGMGAYFRNQHEFILHFSKGRGTDPIRRDVGNVLACPPIRNGSHPTEKPVDLMATLISVLVPPRGIILDPFMGGGSTGVAAIRLGREFIGIELNEKYCEMARKRIYGTLGGVEATT